MCHLLSLMAAGSVLADTRQQLSPTEDLTGSFKRGAQGSLSAGIPSVAAPPPQPRLLLQEQRASAEVAHGHGAFLLLSGCGYVGTARASGGWRGRGVLLERLG